MYNEAFFPPLALFRLFVLFREGLLTPVSMSPHPRQRLRRHRLPRSAVRQGHAFGETLAQQLAAARHISAAKLQFVHVH